MCQQLTYLIRFFTLVIDVQIVHDGDGCYHKKGVDVHDGDGCYYKKGVDVNDEEGCYHKEGVD